MPVIINRFIPFIVQSSSINNSDVLLEPFQFDSWEINKSLDLWFDMDLIKKAFSQKQVDTRAFPLLLGYGSPTRGTQKYYDKKSQQSYKLNYLATVIFGLLSASREVRTGVFDRMHVSEYISGIAGFLDTIIGMDLPEDDIGTLSAMMMSANVMLKEIAPEKFKEYQEMLYILELVGEEEMPVSFQLLRDIDIVMEQELYLFDSRLGFLVNQITIEGLREIDQEFMFSLDLMFRLCSGGFEWRQQDKQGIITQLEDQIENLKISDLLFNYSHYDVVSYGSSVKTQGLREKPMVDNPIIQLLESELRNNLYFLHIKQSSDLISQSEFRTSLKNAGFFREKIDIRKSMNFIYLLIFHEKTQTRYYLSEYRELWTNWHTSLSEALNWGTGQILAGGMKNLSNIYNQAKKLEIFFSGQFADLNMAVKIEELITTLDYHINFMSLAGSSISILLDDINEESGEIKLERLPTLNHESSFIEYIDPKQIMDKLAEKTELENEYSSFRELETSLQNMLQSVQDISQTKQQRWITVALIIFSVTELFLAYLEVFGRPW